MATKDDRPGLLSKVAMFVRNPTRDWSELDQASDGDAAGYDKQALKAMIERKRQNDFVRKREFDQLRKLRNRDPGTLAHMARPSFFQTSLATDLDGRAVTLKKIDEIEAQMSRQWWKARAPDSQLPTATVQGSMQPAVGSYDPKDDSKPYSGPAEMSLPFASTEPMSRTSEANQDMLNEFAPTVMAAEIEVAPNMLAMDDAKGEPRVGFSASALFAIALDEMAADPELEEAAIRFANSDDAGAEAGLLAALRGQAPLPPAAQSWALALLDFYRATANQRGFEVAAQAFAQHLDVIWPEWCVLGESPVDASSPVGTEKAAVRIWTAKATLGAQDMEDLRNAMGSQPLPWHLDWEPLQTIEDSAIALLGGLFDNLRTDAVHMQFSGHEALVQAMRSRTPVGDRAVDQRYWQLRLNALRAMGLQDAFELAALDYCVTFEVAPPEWTATACRVDLLDATPSGSTSGADGSAATSPVGLDGGMASLELPLRGEIQGDASRVLSEFDASAGNGQFLVIDCSALVRVDFAAAGGLLNWVSMRQAEGKTVQFQNVHRLVAAFFNVIGINEYAKVIPRAA
jgi:anti-anti-sigma regulatory factor